ncbi:islet cell autoantigen 1-like protein [Rhynchophorus ferrugineus]|uniref:islet cell autoantigen 1-like protein n=1 Tax=Rhynchophorus ferrugineus TaxID=354439 RepID=UPI003FCE1590
MLPNNMQHQYWVTKKSVLRKLGSKEDECIVSSDAELDAKLELFKSINETCIHLQRIIDLYQEKLCFLAQEENALGRYLKECGKNEKNANAGQLMATAGKALAYTGHQRLTVRPPLVRLHHEVETFRGQAVSDTRVTVSEMEKARTEYRAALSWMKSASSQLDPDTGYGLEKFRKAQSYVKTSKIKFDRYTLACLQKVDLLAAARCNMFSHALVPYQNALQLFATKASETLTLAEAKLSKVEPYDYSIVSELVESPPNKSDLSKNKKDNEKGVSEDKDRNTFFNAEYSDKEEDIGNGFITDQEKLKLAGNAETEPIMNLLGEDFSPVPDPTPTNLDELKPSSALIDLDLSKSTDNFTDFFSGSANFMPSSLMQDETSFDLKIEESLAKIKESPPKKTVKSTISKQPKGKTESQMSWLSLFAELDPLSNGVTENNEAGDRA